MGKRHQIMDAHFAVVYAVAWGLTCVMVWYAITRMPLIGLLSPMWHAIYGNGNGRDASHIKNHPRILLGMAAEFQANCIRRILNKILFTINYGAMLLQYFGLRSTRVRCVEASRSRTKLFKLLTTVALCTPGGRQWTGWAGDDECEKFLQRFVREEFLVAAMSLDWASA